MILLALLKAAIVKMLPEEFIRKTGASYSEIAELCDRSYAEVAKWFCRGKCRRQPSRRDQKILEQEYKLRSYVNRYGAL